ncbi:MI domain-containing protein [Citrus sinensis]|uniref:MI domain-containing protein n=1 Tax=Citrus sinensis TaxID=2711 RepID=A0ACB8IHV3_CITSI|nr:MI domain-containing protein [Citrus sinensis]
MTGERDIFISLDQSFNSQVKLGDGKMQKAVGKGTIAVHTKGDNSRDYINHALHFQSHIANINSTLYLKTNQVFSPAQRRNAKRAQKTKFEEFLEIDRPNAIISAEEDLELERKLAKKFKVKKGKLRREDDGLDLLINGIPSVLDSLEEEEEVPDAKELHLKKKRKKQKGLDQDLEGDLEVGGSESEETNGLDVAMEETPTEAPSRKKRRKRKSVEHGREENVVEEIGPGVANPEETHDVAVPLETPARAPGSGSSVKYVAPHLRPCATKESEEHTQIRRRIRGLLNRLSESNVESITGEVSSIYLSVGRSVSCQIISEEVLASCSSGPRGNEQYAAVFAAFVAGMACMVGIDFSAKLMASLAKSFENEYSKRDNLSLRNLSLLLSYLCIFGVCSRSRNFLAVLDAEHGQWWLSGDMAVKTENVELVASTIDREVLEAQKMLQLAAAQRMNTDAATTIYCDNMSAIALTKNPVFHAKSKHIELRYHYIRDLVSKGEVNMEFISTNEQPADFLTKAIIIEKFEKFKKQLKITN